MKRALRILWLVMLCVLLITFIVVIAGGGYGRKEKPVLIYPGNQSMLLFAHRGLANYYPENSLEGYKAALTHGFKAIETDIRKTADDSLIVFHDENCFRLIGIDTAIHKLTFAELKERVIILNGMTSTSKVISADELFRNIKSHLVIYVDVKLHDTKTADGIAALIKNHHLESSTIVANSNMLFLAWMEFNHPEINTVLEGFNPGKEWIYSCLPKKFKPDFLASFAEELNADHMVWIKSKGLTEQRIVYGVSKENFTQTIDAGIQRMIMDYDSTLQDEITRYR